MLPNRNASSASQGLLCSHASNSDVLHKCPVSFIHTPPSNNYLCSVSSRCACKQMILSGSQLKQLLCYISGPGSSVGTATDYGLEDPGIESRWEARFSAPVQTGPGAHPASCTMGTVSFPGVQRGRGVTLTTHPLLVPWSWKGRAIPVLPLWAVRPVQSLSACTGVYCTAMFQYALYSINL
jgi:hypothetical protein